MITLSGLTKSFGDNCLFTDLSCTLEEGIYCLQGPSGCGKTTLGRILAGLEQTDSGSVTGVIGLPVILFQEPRLLPAVSARKNVACVSRRKDALNGATALLRLLGFTSDDMDKKPDELSGGMQQRVAIARALLFAAENEGNFILLDEPFRGLDPATKENAALLIREITHRVILVITHDESDVALLNGKTLSFPDLQNGIC
jgi:NitT/TauT family transport system ATP-binding protein